MIQRAGEAVYSPEGKEQLKKTGRILYEQCERDL